MESAFSEVEAQLGPVEILVVNAGANADQLLLSMDGGISISEDPNIRFAYRPNGAATFRAEATDTEGHVFKAEWPVDQTM